MPDPAMVKVPRLVVVESDAIELIQSNNEVLKNVDATRLFLFYKDASSKYIYRRKWGSHVLLNVLNYFSSYERRHSNFGVSAERKGPMIVLVVLTAFRVKGS
jgi:hypothetical protein